MFRAITTYQLAPAIHLQACESLTVDKLQHVARSLTDLELSHLGFAETPPWNDGHGLHLNVVLTERILPGEVVAIKLYERCLAFEKESGAWPGAKRRRELKTELLTQLIPASPQRTTTIPVYLSLVGSYPMVMVGTARAALAEDVLKLLRRELGSFPAVPLHIDANPSTFLTQAIHERSVQYDPLEKPPVARLPDCLVPSDKVTMQDKAAKAKARFTGVSLASDEVQECLRNGMQVTQLALVHGGLSSFDLDENLTLRGFELLDINEDALDEEVERWGGDRAMRVIEAAELRAILWNLSLWMGIAPVADAKEAA